MFKRLEHNDLTKRGGDRVLIFANKIANDEQFVTAKGVVVLDKTQHIGTHKLQAEDLAHAMKKHAFTATFKGKNEKGVPVFLHYPKDFLKTPEFGGKGAGSGVAAEDAALVLFRNKIYKARGNDAYINIKINGRIVQVADIISTPGAGGGKNTPKADFTLIDPTEKHVAWISHKAGNKAADFQQYGGLTADNVINTAAETKNFMKDLQSIRPKGLMSGDTFWRPIKSAVIDRHSVYGKDYGKTPGIFNCDEFHLGEMKLVMQGRNYIITSVHKGTNGDISTGDFAPVFIARYDSNSYTASGITIRNCRVGIFARGKVHKKAIEI